MNLELTYRERLEFKNVLPVRASLSRIRLAKQIIDKVKINDSNDINDNSAVQDFDFNDAEIEFLKTMIQFLDEQNQIPFTSLSLIEKILSIKET
jgi:hypothetical protein